MSYLPPSQAVKIARRKKEMSQPEFAELVGKTQPLISRYESGHVEPPYDIYMHCMHIIDEKHVPVTESQIEQMTVDQLNKLISEKLDGPSMANLRNALGIFLKQILP